MTQAAAQNSAPPVDTDADALVKVCVCVLTFRRPEMLGECLVSLERQTALQLEGYAFSVLVVDNDAAETARSTVEAFAQGSAFDVRYICERERGIVHGRNRVLAESAQYDVIAMIDDDETADAKWLESLLNTMNRFRVDIVSGPVLPNFQAAPQWIREGGFFAPRHFPTGFSPSFLETNNILMSTKFLRTHRFDERFNMTSGEDTFFFMQLMRDGASTAWCEEARVTEIVPAARTTEAWLVDRERSAANRFTRCCLYLDPGPKTILKRLSRVVANVTIGLFLVLTPFSMARRVRGRQWLSRAKGTLAALSGDVHIYYKKDQSIT